MLNKADIRAVLLSCETSIADPFPGCLQNGQYFNIYHQSFHLGRQAEGS